MRLLEWGSDGNYTLTDDLHSNIPRYAILSHTWGIDGEEVSFKDLSDNTAKNKRGWTKIRFCGDRAAKDGLRYFWVDTCCIDKSSSAELTEAINSMFRWYSEAVRCYVYLADVAINPSRSVWKLAMKESRWFTRGWTLQELIAPTSVEFFSLEGQPLGDKASLESEICVITGIDVEALRGVSLSDFSNEKRMSWTRKRNTTRKEDKAYCLLGIFGVHMPLIYGEGDYAFTRLNEEIEKRVKSPGGHNQIQHTMRPRQRNCFTTVSHYDVPGQTRALGTKLKCAVCNWEFIVDWKTFKRPTLDGRGIPIEVIWQRFHYRQDHRSMFRCFICRDGETFGWKNLKNHFREKHTYTEICG